MVRDQLSRHAVAVLVLSAFAPLLCLATASAYADRGVCGSAQTVALEVTPNVAQISERWAKEWGAGNLEGLIALYAEDAVFLPATGSRITGRAAIRELFEKALATNSSKLSVHSKVSQQSGELAYDSGEYEETTTSKGLARSGRGNYLVILRRTGPNQWRIIQHMWTDVPTPGQ